jgi:tetratricopeptide (TPR) repeat protein
VSRERGPHSGYSSPPIAAPGEEWSALPLLARSERYRLLRYAGRGSMGAVYHAFDEERGSTVALKAILASEPDWIDRLKREFRSVSGVVHWNLVQLYDLEVSEDACFFTMEFVEGQDFVSHVRGETQGAPSAEVLDRFRLAAPQLVAGVCALHGAGYLHRDIKPSNTKVDAGGRVVLLDFDLVAPVAHHLPMDFASAGVAGTFAYMAPEQMTGEGIGPAADWYGVGGVFYESLTGELPIEELHHRRIVPLLDRAPEAPAWLAALIEALLSNDPDARPTGEEILRCLAQGCAPEAPGAGAGAEEPQVELVGRAREFEQLESTYRKGDVAVIGIYGSSGVGKSELVRTFLARLAASEGDAAPVILAGRCNPQESIRYKALDAIVDALSRYLRDTGESLPNLGPGRAAALTRLFPVLARVPALAEAAKKGTVPDVLEGRRLGIGALRRLLGSLAYREGLIVWIDDVQWGDDDSGTLLGEVLRPPDAPPLLVILSYRTEDRGETPLLSVFQTMHSQFRELSVREIELRPLNREEAVELTRRLCSSRPLSPEQLEAIVNEAKGSPFLIHEMVRYLQSRRASTDQVNLTNVVTDRLADLAADERLALELISLCGRPTERSLILRAAGLRGNDWPLIGRLEGRSLIRVQVAKGAHNVQAYHDRIRETISAELPPAKRAHYHLELAEVFESSGRVGPDLLAHHFHGAGLSRKAADYSAAAAEQAADGLAFERAAQLYRQAREWDSRTEDWQRSLRTREAECVANASRLVEAGRICLAAAEGAPRGEGLELRRRATEHLLAGGSVEEGTAALSALLGDLGLEYPSSARRALLGSATQLARILVRGTEPRGPSELGGDEAIRIDTCFGVGKNLVDLDAARGVYFSVLGLARALRSGDRYRVARSLCLVGPLLSLAGGPLAGRGRKMMERGRALAEELGAKELLGTLGISEGQVLMLRGRWHEARERSDEAVRLLSEECRGFAFLCNIGRGNALRALEEIGEEIPEIARRALQLYEAATSAANVHAETAAVQHLSFVAMARGDLERARWLAQRGIELWDREGFHLQHLYTARAVALCDLYEGRPEASYERFQEFWPALRRSNLMRIPLARVDVRLLRGQLALAMARSGAGAGEAMLKSCENDARRLAREARDDARAHGRILRAGVHALRGRNTRAIPLLSEAARICDGAGMTLRAACARLRMGELLGGEAGQVCMDDALAHIAELGIEEPHRWASMYALGFNSEARGS